jgi:hypothetical protein
MALCPSAVYTGATQYADGSPLFPEVPVRQWVLSVPFPLRYRLAYDSSLVRDVAQIFVRTIFSSIRRRAGVPASNRKARCGAVGIILLICADTIPIGNIVFPSVLGSIFSRQVGRWNGDMVLSRIPKLERDRGSKGKYDADFRPVRDGPNLARHFSAGRSENDPMSPVGTID